MTGTASARADAGRRVPFGAAMQAEYFDDPRYRALFLAHCDIVLPMNELKFGLVHPERDAFRFEPAERIVDFALQNRKRSRGHALVWWNEIPRWLEAVTDAGEAERELERHAEAVVGHFAGRLESWDVVNEAVANDPTAAVPLRDSFWQRRLGARHIEVAFRAAARADPKAKLVLNDYDLEYRGARCDLRRSVIVDTVRRLQDASVRIDAVGLQGHLYTDRDIDVDALGAFGQTLRRLGVDLLVTELDVIDWKVRGGPDAQDAAAAKSVGLFLDGVFAAGAPRAVISWGLTDRYSWVDDAMPHADGTPSRPLPFDRDYRAKGWFDGLERRLRDV